MIAPVRQAVSDAVVGNDSAQDLEVAYPPLNGRGLESLHGANRVEPTSHTWQ